MWLFDIFRNSIKKGEIVMRPTQLQLNFLELKKQEKEETRKEIRRLILELVVTGVCLCMIVASSYLLKGDFLLTKSLFLRVLCYLWLILSFIGLILAMAATGLEPEQEDHSPKLKFKS